MSTTSGARAGVPQHRRSRGLPRDRVWGDATFALWRDPYRYLSKRAREIGSDVFETRLLLEPTACMTGHDAASVFYDDRRFRRAGASPTALQKTLFGQGGVQGLDDVEHAHRKALLLSVATRDRVERLVGTTADEWRRAVAHVDPSRPVVLYELAQTVLTRAALHWAGVPLREADVGRRSSELTALFDAAGSLSPRHLLARLARRRSERWAAELIGRIRTGRLEPGVATAAHRIAMHRTAAGDLLPERLAAVELLNVLRPTVAIAVFVTFAVHALHEHPEHREELRSGSRDAVTHFVNEVRRFYPFFPAVPARVRCDFEWNGWRFRTGMRALLDLYGINHDPRIWEEPGAFRPARFRGREPDAFSFVPQGGGEPTRGHRCAGEEPTIAVLERTLRFFVDEIDYRLPEEQNRMIDFGRLPALPHSRMVLTDLRLR